eukprot:293163-Ditylum_brightwellii.AAC.1
MFNFGGARAGKTLTMASGLNVIGCLVFPDGSKVTIETPSVFVQGILGISSACAITGEPDVCICMTGNTNINFTPEGENSSACSGCACNVGPKAFAVAGGQLDINGMPDSCPTWSHILSVGHAAQSVPADFPLPPSNTTREMKSQTMLWYVYLNRQTLRKAVIQTLYLTDCFRFEQRC